MPSKTKIFIALVLILIIAIFFRFWKIGQTPPGLYPDEAMNGNNALEAIKTGQFKLFYPENNGREGLFINIQAISLMIFGSQPWALRIVSAIFGILTVLGLFFLAKELFPQKPNIALFSAFLLAVSFWHVNFSRIGFRAIMVPFCLVWSFAFLFRALRTKKILPAIFAGIFFGAGFHAYIAFRFAPLLALIPIFRGRYFSRTQENESNKKQWKILIIWLTVTFIVALPIGLYFLNNPADFFGRSGEVSVFQQSSPILSFLKSVAKTLLMFNVSGDCNWRHNVACWPELNPLSGLAFLLGCYWLIRNLIKKTEEKPTYQFMAGWFLVMALPALLTNEGLPHALRSIGLIPIIFILAGSGLNLAWEWLKTKLANRRFLYVILFGLLAIIMIFEGWLYFGFWAKNKNVQGAFGQPLAQIGRYLNNQPSNLNKYALVNIDGVLVNDIPMPAQTIMFLTNTYLPQEQQTKNLFYLLPKDFDKIEITGPAIITPLKNNAGAKKLIERKFPNASVKNFDNFEVWELP
jgi:4-amino-4-deoxy-L-arabinose transferase-like glycosyltransferase